MFHPYHCMLTVYSHLLYGRSEGAHNAPLPSLSTHGYKLYLCTYFKIYEVTAGFCIKKFIHNTHKSFLFLLNMWTKPPICDKSQQHGSSDHPTTVHIEVHQHKKNKIDCNGFINNRCNKGISTILIF